MSEDLQTKGLRELNEFLQQLPAKVEKNVLRGALRAGAAPVRDQVKVNAPEASGELKNGIVISTSSKGSRVIAKIKATGKHAHLAVWFEFTGVAQHIIKAKDAGFLFFNGVFTKKVTHPGVPAKPFMRPALVARANDAVVASAQYMKNRLVTKHGLDTSDVEIGPK